MEYKHYVDFMPSLRELRRQGGPFARAATQVQSVVGSVLLTGADPLAGLKPTNHGENRIAKCIKYDLTGFARLVTIQDSGIVLFCFAGDHDACDKWLDKHRGLRLAADENGRLIDVLATTPGSHNDERPTGETALTSGKLFNGIQPETYFDRLVDGVPRALTRQLEDLESIHDESAIFELTKSISDVGQAQAIYDTFVLLRQDKREQALKRVKLYLRENREIGELTLEEIKELAESDKIKTIPADDPRFQQVFEHFAKTASYMDWMLFLHPGQQSVVDRDFSSPAKLVGVSGSGKTCITVNRAIRLAQKYTNEQILILTLNRQLSRLIDDMVTAACPEDLRSHISVKPFFLLCKEYLNKFEPQNCKLYDDVTWKMKEHIDEIWREFYRCELNNDDAAVLQPVHDSLISRSVSAEQYLREEFDWIRSAVPPGSAARRDYLNMERTGRSHPLDERFRRVILEGLSFWEKKMIAVGVTDYLGIATALFRHLEKIQPDYRCVLVDESQDFGTIEYKIIRKLAAPNENDLFFCGDAAQQVSAKHRSFRDAGIAIPSKFSLLVKKNYRNSREILAASYDVLSKNWNLESEGTTDFEVLSPEDANFSGSMPLMLLAKNLEEEIAFALRFARDELESESEQKICIAFAGFSLYEIQKFGACLNIAVLDGNTKIDTNQLFFSDLEHTKGFEFHTVIILNCNKNVLPDPAQPEQEQGRDLARLYVAMTRAKNQMIVSCSALQSPFLDKSEDYLSTDNWSSYVDYQTIERHGVPLHLESLRRQETDSDAKDIMDMNGREILYTEYAVGLSSLLIDKLRRLISGQKKLVSGVPVEWPTLRAAGEDTRQYARSRQVFGAEGIVQFREFLIRIKKG